MDKITIKQANIIYYIEKTNKESLIKDVKQLVDLHPEYLLKDYIKNFLKKYEKTCKYFIKFYYNLFNDINLTDFYKQSFVLEL